MRRSGPEIQDPRINSLSKHNCIAACIQAAEKGGDKGLMMDPHGFVSTCNSTHFFVVRNGEVSWQYGSHEATEWHGEFYVGTDGWLTIKFHCRAELDKMKVTTVWKVGLNRWVGRDTHGTRVTLELAGMHVWTGTIWGDV